MGTVCHYSAVIMGAIASQITSLTIVYSTVNSDADQRKHQSSASLAFVRGIHRRRMNSPHKWPVTRKMFPFDDVIMKMSHSDETLYGVAWCLKVQISIRHATYRDLVFLLWFYKAIILHPNSVRNYVMMRVNQCRILRAALDETTNRLMYLANMSVWIISWCFILKNNVATKWYIASHHR